MTQRCKSCSFRWTNKATAWLLAVGLLLLGSGCAYGKSDALYVGVTVYDQSDTFISSVSREIEELLQGAEEENGLRINLISENGGGNQTAQMEQVSRMIQQGCDVLCVNIVDRTAAASMIDLAEAADVPIIFFNREPVAEDINRWEHVYYVGARAEQSGILQGQLVAQAWEQSQETLDRNGDGVLQYVMLEGEPGHQDALLRTEYSLQALSEAGVSVERLAGDTANWNRGQAMAKTQKWIEEFGEEIEAVLSNNDDMALGAIDAFEAANMPLPLVVGVDATAPAMEAIRAGKLYATVRNDGEGIAAAVVQLALAQSGQNDVPMPALTEEHYIWLQYEPVNEAPQQ